MTISSLPLWAFIAYIGANIDGSPSRPSFLNWSHGWVRLKASLTLMTLSSGAPLTTAPL